MSAVRLSSILKECFQSRENILTQPPTFHPPGAVFHAPSKSEIAAVHYFSFQILDWILLSRHLFRGPLFSLLHIYT